MFQSSWSFYIRNQTFELFEFKNSRVRIWPSIFKGQLMPKYFCCLKAHILISYSIFNFEDFRVWPWRFTSEGHLGSKNYTIRKPIYDFLFDFYGHHFSISYRFLTVFEIFDFKFLGFDLDFWPLKVIWGRIFSYHLKAQIWLPIWLLWTPSLYLLPFSRYSTSNILGFDLDLWPQKIIWGQNFSYRSKVRIWLPICFLWTPSLYLLPFSRYSTSKFLGFDLDLWPLKVIFGQKNLFRSKAHMWLPIWLLWTPSLYLLQFSRHST